MTDNLRFRVATIDEAGTARELIQAAFRANDARPDWTGDMGLASSFTMALDPVVSTITNPNSEVLLGIDGKSQIVGCVSVLHKQEVGAARIAWLAVDQHQHRGGIGRRMLEQAENHCERVWGVDTIGLNALCTRQALISWYERRGYRRTGDTTPFPTVHVEGATLPDDLHFVEMEKRMKK
ncbi:hypothetical protein S7711_07383 [Stachybotrys chartarum IBT 7711]|uniref:N-acetyltransferase domain-containing protein n=1 Tax=Stachybotrys chartarum (strain CBS 109288 / IBT 7711) TaxID=1280523 RepID=A0A084AFE0_STACB|nr:hypothetical protein S7711_07383 [Stachybotrys chartarum IBT 7711]